MDWLRLSFYHAVATLWATFWALVLGFTISGMLQVFVSKERMSRAFGRASLRSVAMATGLGAASSSCSYAAVAAARSAVQQGAALVPALAFMFASTNLVIEQPNTVFRNLGGMKFAALTAEAGFTAQPPSRHRGSAVGDLNGDGKLDLVVNALNVPA